LPNAHRYSEFESRGHYIGAFQGYLYGRRQYHIVGPMHEEKILGGPPKIPIASFSFS